MKKMKKLFICAAIAVVLFSACGQIESRKEGNEIIQKVSDMQIDSCQYTVHEDILYFSAGDTAVRIGTFSFIVYGEDLRITQTPEVRKEIQSILIEKWPVPERYSSVSLRHFKNMIETTPIDSSFIKQNVSNVLYYFYLGSYMITINVDELVKFESRGEISTYTKDIYGEWALEFSSTDLTKWSQEDQQEILQLLLSKLDKEDSISYEVIAK